MSDVRHAMSVREVDISRVIRSAYGDVLNEFVASGFAAAEVDGIEQGHERKAYEGLHHYASQYGYPVSVTKRGPHVYLTMVPPEACDGV